MVNEFGVDINTFNIGDYIWYIVGGVSLFFVIVGFIADKSGLAKKTFSKGTKKVEKTDEKIKEPIIEEVLEGIESNDASTDEIPVIENVSYDVNTDVLLDDDNVSDNTSLYISENPDVSDSVNYNSETDENLIELFDEQNELNLEKNDNVENVWDDNMASVMSEENKVVEQMSDVSDMNDIVIEPLEITENNMIGSDTEVSHSNIASENAEEEWGVEPALQSNDDDSLIDVALPSLDDIETNKDEDVWKF